MIRARITQLAADFLSGVTSPALVATPLGEIIFANAAWRSAILSISDAKNHPDKLSLSLQQHLADIGLTPARVEDWIRKSLPLTTNDQDPLQSLTLPLPSSPFLISFKAIRHDGVVIILLTAIPQSGKSIAMSPAISDTIGKSEAHGIEPMSYLGYQFIKGMGHEYRTPLSSIMGFLDLALIEPLNESARQHLLDAQHAAQALLGVISDVTELGDPGGGTFAIQHRPTEVEHLLSRIIALVERRATEKRLQLVTKLSEEMPPSVIADDRRIGQLLLQALLLIIEHATPRGGIVVYVDKQFEPLTASDRTDTIVVSLGFWDDTISELEVKQLFSSNFLSINPHTNLCQLRLIFIRQLLDRLGGGLKVHHIARCGLRLDIQLPIKLDDSANQSNKTHPEEALEKRPLRVLVAEDNPINARVISLMLEHLGARFIVVHNGKEAVNAFAQDETGFDLVLMDCQMPDLDGFDATREIREFEQDRATRTKIVAMTAYALPGDKEACLAAGMDDYLSKPISSRQLSAVLNQELS